VVILNLLADKYFSAMGICGSTGEAKVTAARKPGLTAAESPKHASKAQSTFKKYDKNCDGTLDKTELANYFTDAFPDFDTQGHIDELMQLLDLRGDGKIHENELKAFVRHYDAGKKTIKTVTALVIIDVQNDFITGSLANPFEAVNIVPLINGLRDKFDHVVISYDWHPQEHCSFVESAKNGTTALVDPVPLVEGWKDKLTPLTMVKLAGDADRPEHDQCMFPRHAVQNTEGGKCHSDLIVKDEDIKVYKGTKPNIDSYSAFFDNCQANDTGLTAALEAKGVTDVYCVGLVFDFCVKSSALHGVEQGFNCSIIEDATRPFLKDMVPAVKEELAKAGVELFNSDEAMRRLTESPKEMTLEQYMARAQKCRAAKQIHAAVIKSTSAQSHGFIPSS
jgi:nicotinamidase/pyrazinamidase